MSDSRSKTVCRARAEIAYRLHVGHKLSLAHIGRLIDRHPASVANLITGYELREGLRKPPPPYDPNQPDESGLWI